MLEPAGIYEKLDHLMDAGATASGSSSEPRSRVVTLADAIAPTVHARVLLEAKPPFAIVHCSPGWYLLTGYRFEDIAQEPFFGFTTAPRALLRRLQKSCTTGKRVLGGVTIRPAQHPDEPSFPAVVSICPIYPGAPADHPGIRHTHVSVRLIKLIAKSVKPPHLLLSKLNFAQRRALRSIIAYRPASSYEHKRATALCPGLLADDDTQSLTSGSFTDSMSDRSVDEDAHEVEAVLEGREEETRDA